MDRGQKLKKRRYIEVQKIALIKTEERSYQNQCYCLQKKKKEIIKGDKE